MPIDEFSHFDEYSFRHRMQKALSQVKLILDSNRRFNFPDETPHSYQDKYLLIETCTRISIAACVQILSGFGITSSHLDTLLQWVNNKEVSLRFESNETCSFISESTRSEEDPHSIVTSNRIGVSSTTKSFTKFTEYNYKLDVTYRLIAYKGVGVDDNDIIYLLGRSSCQNIILRSKESPYAESNTYKYDANISWLLRRLSRDNNGQLDYDFTINRSHAKCFTPRRNKELLETISFFVHLCTCLRDISQYIMRLSEIQKEHTPSKPPPDLNLILRHAVVFIPVLPFFEHHVNEEDDECHVVGLETIGLLLDEMNRSYGEVNRQLETSFSSVSNEQLICIPEAILVNSIHCIGQIVMNYLDTANYIESILYKQLISAVGKIVMPSDFDSYMHFHYRRLLRDEFQPKPFSHSVRRSSAHSPEGTVRIEQSVDGKTPQPLLTFSRSDNEASSSTMQLALSASTKVLFAGERHVHLYLAHSFSEEGHCSPTLGPSLVAQARQFSSFILLVGRIASATEFDPKHGIILQNKDEVIIPLLLEQVPTAKEFKRAVQSLSPEQQQFASAIRSMQLSGTVFGVLVIQIKPHMERLLLLKQDSLTKEIALGQDLMDMFIKYQIPSDLLSFDGDENTSAEMRVNQVRQHVDAIKAMITLAKEAEVEEKRLQDLAIKGAQSDDSDDSIHYRETSLDRLAKEVDSEPVILACMAPLQKPSMFKKMAAALMPRRSSASNNDGASFMPAPVPMREHVEISEDRGADMPFITAAPSISQSAPEIMPITEQSVVFDTISEDVPKDAVQDQPQEPVNVNDGSLDATQPIDLTSLPIRLDEAHDKLDPDSALRATIINPSDVWTKKYQQGLMRPMTSVTLYADDLVSERCAAYDLLDALSRSGSIVLKEASLHVIIASTHNFDKSIMDTVIVDNVNPIERVERSCLILASTLQNIPSMSLLREDQVVRVQSNSPSLFLES